MAEKIFYSMGEVAEMFDVNASLIRHWQKQFGNLIRPERNKKGNRLFSPQDVENLKLIYHLVKERGLTLDGAKKAMKQQRAEHKGVLREVELLERLQRIRSLLAEVREDLKSTDEELVADAPPVDSDEAVFRRAKPVVRVPTDAADEPQAERQEIAGRARNELKQDKSAPKKSKKEGDEPELFAFYEQSLF